jgi:ribonuclease HII
MASLRIERRLWSDGYEHVAGVDEAGRGCLAGPVVAAAVIFEPGRYFRGIKDSKLLSREERTRLARTIRARAVAVGVGTCSPEEIDRLNVLWASMEAMRRAVSTLRPDPSYVLVDGDRVFPGADWPAEAVIGGDRKSQSIAAASIIAKVERDRLMRSYHEQYPQYEWMSNVGYPTRAHYRALQLYGSTPLHRCSFNLKNPYDAAPDTDEAPEPATVHSDAR